MSLPYAECTETTALVTRAYKWDSFSVSTGIAGTVHAEGIQGVQEALHLLRMRTVETSGTALAELWNIQRKKPQEVGKKSEALQITSGTNSQQRWRNSEETQIYSSSTKRQNWL